METNTQETPKKAQNHLILIGDNAFHVEDIRRVGIEHIAPSKEVGAIWLRSGEKMSVEPHLVQAYLSKLRAA